MWVLMCICVGCIGMSDLDVRFGINGINVGIYKTCFLYIFAEKKLESRS